MKLEDVDEARASWMKLEMICIQLCQGAVSVGCTDKPCIVDSVPDHMVVVAFQKLAAFIPVVVQEPLFLSHSQRKQLIRFNRAFMNMGKKAFNSPKWITSNEGRFSISQRE